MKIAITDANIFIDLIYIKLHEELFALDLEIHTTFEVFEELNENQKSVLDKFVKRTKLTLHKGDQFVKIESIQSRKSLSESDKSVLHLAIHLQAFVLTGDGHMRKVSGIQKIEVHGIFWLLDNFISNELINKKQACKQLKYLMEYNKRLRFEECEKRLAEWGK
jgi:predicted nucleic acid-binding protein